MSLHPGAWQYRTVHGEQIIMMTLPEQFTPRLWDSGQQILAVRGGHVRRGTFTPAGTPETFGEINFNADCLRGHPGSVEHLLIDAQRKRGHGWPRPASELVQSCDELHLAADTKLGEHALDLGSHRANRDFSL